MKKNIYYLFILLCLYLFGCSNDEVENCSIKFINPVTRQYIEENNVFIRYDETMKTLDYIAISNETGQEVDIIWEINIVYTNIKTKEKSTYMLNKGEYILSIEHCKYDNKYNLNFKDLRINIVYGEQSPISLQCGEKKKINIGENNKFSFTSSISSNYRIKLDDCIFKVFDSIGNLIVEKREFANVFIEKESEIIIEVCDSKNYELECEIMIDPYFISTDKVTNIQLKNSNDILYKYSFQNSHTLYIYTIKENTKVQFYSSQGDFLYDNSFGKSFNYIAKEEVYIRIFSDEEVLSDEITFAKNPLIEVGSIYELTIFPEEEIYIPFHTMIKGKYFFCEEIIKAIEVTYLDVNGLIISNNEMDHNTRFIKLKNQSLNKYNLEIKLDYFLEEVKFGLNKLYMFSDYVSFKPNSSEIYFLEGVSKIYDESLSIIEIKNNISYLEKDKIYYMNCNSDYIKISFPVENELLVMEKLTFIPNKYDIYYFKLNILYDSLYTIMSLNNNIIIYNLNDLLPIYDISSYSEISLGEGSYIIKVHKSSNGVNDLLIDIGIPITIGTDYYISNNGYVIYNYENLNNSNYYIDMKFDKYSNIEYEVFIYELNGNAFDLFWKINNNSNHEFELLDGKYYFIIELKNANNQAALFNMVRL